MVQKSKRSQLPKAPITIIDAIKDKNLFAPWFEGEWESWENWLVFLKAIFGLKLNKKELNKLAKFTGRKVPLSGRADECWLICGRRSGKSFIVALVAAYLATFINWKQFLKPGERGMVVIIASDRKQARAIFNYLTAFITGIPLLNKMVTRKTNEIFELSNQVSIEIQTASFRSVRGYTIVAALLDEVAFWSDETSTNPDKEILTALRPAMATIPGAMLFAASSPYYESGILYEAYNEYYGKDDKGIIVWKGPTWDMNPTIPEEFFNKEKEKDPISFMSEYGAEFRKGAQGLFTREILDNVTVKNRFELPYNSNYEYIAFVDPSGGISDSYVLAIAHEQDSKRVLDLVREYKPPFSPDEVTAEIASIVRQYGLTEVFGDNYAGEWPKEAFSRYDIKYNKSPLSRSAIYSELIPKINSGTVELLDDQDLYMQLLGLVRRPGKRGRDVIDHQRGKHDDVANAAAGALVLTKVRDPVELW